MKNSSWLRSALMLDPVFVLAAAVRFERVDESEKPRPEPEAAPPQPPPAERLPHQGKREMERRARRAQGKRKS